MGQSTSDPTSSRCSSVRVNIAGNQIGSQITPESITPLERIFRKLPVEGVLTATPDRPFTFELGAIVVPSSMSFVLLDSRFAIHIPTGLAAGDTQELEDRRLSRIVGYDVRFSDTRDANFLFEMEPSNPEIATTTYASSMNAGSIPGDGISGVSPAVFDSLRTSVSMANISAGSSTIPQRHRRESQLSMPFTYIVQSNKRVNFDVIVRRPIPIPISFFEVEVSGMLIGANALADFMSSVRPCVPIGSV